VSEFEFLLNVCDAALHARFFSQESKEEEWDGLLLEIKRKKCAMGIKKKCAMGMNIVDNHFAVLCVCVVSRFLPCLAVPRFLAFVANFRVNVFANICGVTLSPRACPFALLGVLQASRVLIQGGSVS